MPTLALAEIRHVLHITVDGLRGDLLQNLINSQPANYPNFKKIVDEGSTTFNARCDFDYSETIPNHCGVVTGRPVNNPPGMTSGGHAYTSNGYSGTATSGDSIHQLGSATYLYKVSTFDMAHDRGYTTAIYGGKTRMNLFVHSYNATKGRADLILPDNGKNKVDFASVADLTTTANLPNIKNAVVADITAGTVRHYNLIHFTDTDTGQTTGGHNVGWGASGWNQGVKDVDGYLGAIFAAIAANPALNEHVALILTADHGGGGGGSGPGATADRNHGDSSSLLNYRTPVLLWGPGIPAGTNAYRLFRNRAEPADARPTAAANVAQPLRNTDTGNIALALLGVPPIEGSYFRADFDAHLQITDAPTSIILSWPSYLTNFRLQSSLNLASGPWVDEPPVEPTEVNGFFTREIPKSPGEIKRFWRLMPPP